LVFDEVAVQRKLTDQGIDLSQAQRHLGSALQIAPHKTVLPDAHFQGRRAGVLHAGDAVLLDQRQHAQNAAHAGLAILAVHRTAEGSDLGSGSIGPRQQLQDAPRCLFGAIFLLDAVAAAGLTQVFAQQFSALRMQQPHPAGIPLHLDFPSNPARGSAVVGRLDLHATVQMHRAFPVLVIAEGLEWQR
jgi:hypothetical protein